MSAKLTKEELKQIIKDMSVMELVELVKDLEEEFGIKAMQMAAPSQGSSGDSSQEVSKKEQVEFSVLLKGDGGNKIPVIKEVREITSLSLKDAKTLVEAGDKYVKEKIKKTEAEEIKSRLEKVGAIVEIV